MPIVTDADPTSQVPLAVDLDGTLIRSDMMWESLARLLREQPLTALAAPFWWSRGRAFLKQQLAAHVQVDATTLPYNEPFLDWLRGQKRAGRKLVLATASDRKMAEPVARHVGLFDEVLASDGRTNLRDAAKLNALTRKFGERGFDYAGNSTPDLEVWRGSREAVIVNASPGLVRRAATCAKVGPIFPEPESRLRALLQTLQPVQWLKNLLVFAPIIATGHTTFWPMLSGAGAWLALCYCDSGLAGLADLLNLDADRRCAATRSLPLASGRLPLSWGLLLFPALLVFSFLIAWEVTTELVLLLVVYLIGATAVASRARRAPAMDALVRALLYGLRVLAGVVATGVVCPLWLIVGSLLIFPVLAVTEGRSARIGS